jgi:hypothetical protein
MTIYILTVTSQKNIPLTLKHSRKLKEEFRKKKEGTKIIKLEKNLILENGSLFTGLNF